MLYSKSNTFPCHAVGNIMNALREAPKDYIVYAQHVDAIYPITDIVAEDDVVSFFSEETYGKEPSKSYSVGESFEKLCKMAAEGQFYMHTDARLEAAENVDENLDLQLDEPCEIKGWGTDNVCRIFFLIAGTYWDYA